MVVHNCNLSTQEAETGGLQQVQYKPGLHNEFEASLEYIVRPFLKNTTKKNYLSHKRHLL